MKCNFLSKLNLKELEELSLIISDYNNINEIISEINKLKMLKKNVNSIIPIEKAWFSQESYNILVNNGIFTAEDLVNCDVHSLKGIGVITGEEISWGKKFYDFSNVNADEKESKKLIK